MQTLKQKLKNLHRRNSKRHAFLLFLFLFVALGISSAMRYYALVPLRMMDTSMAPDLKERDMVWMCKLPLCLTTFKEGDIVWANLRGNEYMVRKVLALPGDSIRITDQGRVTTPQKTFKWKQEDAFIQNRTFYVPKAGDTLKFEELNDVEQDYVIGYLRNKGERIIVQTSLWQGEHEINLDRVGATKIANRQVSLNEIDFLPWQDRFLIEMQIRQSEPGNAPITLRRKIFRGIKKEILASPAPSPANTSFAESSAADSTANFAKTVPDSTTANPMQAASADSLPPKPGFEIILEPIDSIAIEDDCYYLVCSKGNSCPDSRETGYVTIDKIAGRYVEWPTQVNNAVVTPALHNIKRGFDLATELVNNIATDISELFSSDDETKTP